MEKKKKSLPVLRKPSTNPKLADSPFENPLHAKSHGRSLRDITNNEDHHYPISIGKLG